MRDRRVRKAASMSDAATLNSADGPRPAASGMADRVFVLTPEFDVVGSICIDGRVRLECVIDGEIRCSSLDVTRDAQVRGQIVAETVTVYGVVSEASIYARVLVLKPGCSVEGEIYHEHLQLEPGSYFDGKSRRVDDPLSMAPNWNPPAGGRP